MDERYRNYLKYIDKFDEAREANSEHDGPEGFDQSIKDVFNNIKDQNYAEEYSNLMYLISFLLLAVVILQFIQLGLTMRMLVMLIPLGFFLVYRAIVKLKTREITSRKTILALAEGKESEKLIARIDYLKAGISLNESRIKYTMWLYIFIVPFMIFSILELIRGSFEISQNIYLILGAIVLCGLAFHYLFKQELEELDLYSEELEELKSFIID